MADSGRDVAQVLGIGAHAKPHRRWIWLALAAAILAGGGWVWFAQSNPDRAVRFSTAEATVADFTVTVTATGSIQPTNLVEISSELSGTLKSVNVDYNDEVEVGAILAELDTATLEAELAVRRASLDAAVARVAMARATLEEAKDRFDATVELQQRGTDTRQMLISRKADFIRAQAELQSARADKALAEANLDLQQTMLDKACICAPIRGVVLDREADTGQIVASTLSAPVLFTLAEDLSQMELQVDVDEADIGQVSPGNAATFTVDAYDDREFPAEISTIRFAPEIIEGVVTYKAVLTIDNGEMLLRPGMTATADITVEERQGVLTVPNAALRYAPPPEPEGEDEDRSGLLGMLIPSAGGPEGRENTKTVWVLRDGEAREIAVEVGPSNGQVTEIQGGELSPGDLVITDLIDG